MDLTTNAVIAPLTAPAASLRPYAGPTTIADRVRTGAFGAVVPGTRRPQIIPGPQVQVAQVQVGEVQVAEVQVAKQHTWLTAAGFAGTGMSAVANAGRPPRGVLQ